MVTLSAGCCDVRELVRRARSDGRQRCLRLLLNSRCLGKMPPDEVRQKAKELSRRSTGFSRWGGASPEVLPGWYLWHQSQPPCGRGIGWRAGGHGWQFPSTYRTASLLLASACERAAACQIERRPAVGPLESGAIGLPARSRWWCVTGDPSRRGVVSWAPCNM